MLEFLLTIQPIILILVISVVISTVMVFIYKWMTDQDVMKRLKEELKELQAEIKTLRDNPTKMADVNKQMMETNMKYFMHSMKPTLVTFLPIILIFGWLSSNIAFDPLITGAEFSVELEFYEGITGNIISTVPKGLTLINGESYTIKDNKVRLVFQPEVSGKYTLQYTLQNNDGEAVKTWEHDVRIASSSKERGYEKTPTVVKDEILKTMTVNLQKFLLFGDSFSLFGWQPGWLSLYIIVSIIVSLGLRKMLNVY